MRYLLDTHVFIWWYTEPERLSTFVHDLLLDNENDFLLSLVSVWEIQIKVKLGKLKFTKSLREMLDEELKVNHVELLLIRLPHILAIDTLPDIHKDPFDRLLIAQAIEERLPLITDDPQITKYPVEIIWKPIHTKNA